MHMKPQVLEAKDIRVRKYLPSDRDAVRALCCDTGFLGQPIDPVFADRELFADFLTGYYLRHEPDCAFVVTVNNEIRGYLLGSRQPYRHQIYSFLQNIVLAAKMLVRYPSYNRESREFVHWLVSKAWREVPAAPRRVGHFHVNLLPDARSILLCRCLLETYLRYLYEKGVRRTYGQMVTFDGRRGFKLFERYGFKVLNQSEITKYRRFTNQSVYLCTVLKELEEQGDRLLYQVKG
jgi:hypothetical protein